MNPAFFAVNPVAQYDSFLTIGIDGPALNPGALSSVGLDFNQWTEAQGIDTDNGAVFFMVSRHTAAALLALDALMRLAHSLVPGAGPGARGHHGARGLRADLRHDRDDLQRQDLCAGPELRRR